jgi:hypothetical protein
MAGHSESTASLCRALFDTALQAYEKKTSITLVQHPLALQLQDCDSVESIASFLQDQIPSSSDSGGSNRVMASIRNMISILSNLSAASALAWANDMVYEIKALMECSTPLTAFFTDVLTRKCNTCQSRHLICCKCPSLFPNAYHVTSECIRRPRGSILAMMSLSSCSNRSKTFLSASPSIPRSPPQPPRTRWWSRS